jgi:AGCS family alanine or glycine:cation symporter
LMLMLKISLLGSAFYGTIREAGLAWVLGDIGVGLMAWLNIIGILLIFLMSRPAIKALRDYERQQKAGVEHYTFDPEALGIKNADFWADRVKSAAQKGPD